MDVTPRLRQTELLLLGFFHCAGVLIDRLVENGVMERIEIDAALQAVEDGAFASPYTALYRDEEDRRWISRPARVLRIINELGSRGRILNTSDLEAILNFKRDL